MWTTLAILTLLVIGGALYYFYRAHQTISDATIVKNVKAKLYDDVNLRKCTIEVTAQNGVVTLVGLVNSEADKENALQIAGQQHGAKQVIDNLVLQGLAPPSRVTIEVPADQAWTATGIFLNAGAVVAISASGNVSMGGGWPPMPPSGRPPDCGGRGGFPAPQLPCWSLIGRIGEQGTMFYVGSKVTFQAPTSGQLFLGVNDDILGDNSGSWTATVIVQPASRVSSSNSAPSDLPSPNSPRIVQAVIRPGETALELSPARAYVFAMVTEGGRPSSPFEVLERMERGGDCNDAGGSLFAQLASLSRDTLNQNSYTTETARHVIGGVSVSGTFRRVEDFLSACGGVQPVGGDDSFNYNVASVNFTVNEEGSLVVVIALSNGAWNAYISGIPGLQNDASTTGGELRMLIEHAYMHPGSYTANLLSFRGKEHGARSLVGAFVFAPES